MMWSYYTWRIQVYLEELLIFISFYQVDLSHALKDG